MSDGKDLLPDWLYRAWPWGVSAMAIGYAWVNYWAMSAALGVYVAGIVLYRRR